MPHLITASMRVHRSFLTAMAEFQAEGGDRPGDDSNTGQAIRKYASRWADPAEVARYVQQLEGEARDQSPRRGRVPQTTLWWVSGDEYLGRISIRHRLTAHLRRSEATSVTTSGPQHDSTGTLPQCSLPRCP